jgi:glycosyltransferase involved in cell wall biosynthesis
MRRSGYRMTFAWSERAGIPYAGMRSLLRDQGPFAAMFTCWSKRQEQAVTKLKLFDAMDTIAVHCESMKRNFIRLGAPEHKVHVIHYSVDHRFFSPLPDIVQEPGLILSLGETRSRNYPALVSAMQGLPARLLIAASGSWYAREKNSELTTSMPENVTLLERLSLAELKQLYARSQFVVLPLLNQVYSAGATASLEAMCMGRAVVAFRSEGILDFIEDGETGLLVEPGNMRALRDAMQYLLENPQEARRLGENGRQRIHEELNLDLYVRRIGEWLEACT